MMQNPANAVIQFTKCRIAPTPSGFLHLGNILSFAFTAELAQSTGAKTLLRIDDLDRDRVKQECLQDIFDTLNYLEIPRDEGPRDVADFEATWSQINRMGLYLKMLDELKTSGKVFACTCSRSNIKSASGSDLYPGTCRDKDIPLDAPGANWRLKTDPGRLLKIKTLKNGVIETQLPPDMQYFVVRKKDGYPAYQLASLVDDLYFGTDLIVRGNDLWNSTLGQIFLAEVLQIKAFKHCTFHHHPLLTDNNGDKLSKSAGATSIKYLREQGKTPGDIFTLIAGMLGFSVKVSNWQELAQLV